MVDQRQRWLPRAIHATFQVYREQGASAWIWAQGDSMRPLIAPGAQLLVEFGAAPLRIGDIVIFDQGQRLIAHRLVGRRPGGWIAKGDAEPYTDAPLDPSDILGIVRALRRGADGIATYIGCGGASARGVARISRWLGRCASIARRAATFLPGPLRRLALRAIPPFVRVAALALFAPVWWAAQIQAVRVHGIERR